MSDDPSTAMRERLRADLKAAMREKKALEVSVLRSLIGAIDNAQAIPTEPGRQPYVSRAFGDNAVEVSRLVLSEDDVRAVLAGEAAARLAAADELDGCGRPVEAEALRDQAAVAMRYCSDGD